MSRSRPTLSANHLKSHVDPRPSGYCTTSNQMLSCCDRFSAAPCAGVYDKLCVRKCSGGAVHQAVVPVQVAQSVSRGCDFYHGEDFFFHGGMSGYSDEAQVVQGFFGFVNAEFAEPRLDECHADGKIRREIFCTRGQWLRFVPVCPVFPG